MVRCLLTLAALMILCSTGERVSHDRAVAAAPSSPERSPHIVVVTVPYLNWDVLTEANTDSFPSIRRLVSESAIGQMNTTTAGDDRLSDAYLTLGGGVRLRAGPYGGSAGGTNDSHRLYEWRTGRRPLPGEIVEPDIEAIINYNADLDYPTQPGLLAGQLERHGWRIELYRQPRNFESSSIPERANFAVLSAMNEAGAVAGGDLGPQAAASFHQRLRAWPERTVLWYDFDSLVELEENREFLSSERLLGMQQQAFRELDQLLQRLFAVLENESDGQLWFLSPTAAPQDRRAGKRLTPVLLWSADSQEKHLLFSGTTRRAGLVANLDFAPSLLAALEIMQPSPFMGRPWTVIESAAPNQLEQMRWMAESNFQRRSLLIKGYVSAVIVLLLATGVSLLLRRVRWLSFLCPILLAVTCVPLSYLVLPWLGPLAPYPSLFMGLLIVIAFAMIATRLTRFPSGPFGLIAGLTSLMILWDVWTGADLMIQSPLGYSPIAGARYYGVGNEFMGVWIGSTLLAVAVLLDRFSNRRHWLIPAVLFYFALVFYSLASPGLGANFGGSLTAAAAFAYTSIRLIWPHGYTRRMLWAAGAAALLVGVILLLDITRPAAIQSHVARALIEVQARGWPAAVEILERKASMNIRLIRYTDWSYVLFGAMAVYGLLLFRPIGMLKSFVQRHPDLTAGLSGVAVASVTALLTNDSGVVAAATTVVFAIAALIVLVVDRVIAAADTI